LLFAVIVSALVAVTAACGVLLVQALAAQSEQALKTHHRAVVELARSSGGLLTPSQVAAHFQIDAVDADRLLRSMVDDRYVRMKVCDRRAELLFWFTELTKEPEPTPRSTSRKRSAANGARTEVSGEK
jgi:hypothetical protein